MIKFEEGKTYSCRSIADYDCIFSFTILSRTRQTVFIRGSMTEGRRKIRIRDGVEEIDPLGRYSMSPILSAEKVA